MCSRFENQVSPETLEQRFGALAPPGYWMAAEIRPDNAICCIGPAGAAMRRWGLKAPWDGKLLINARLDTLPRRATFRPLLDRRCLVPATAWFEWQAVEGSRRKTKYRLSAADGGAFALAALDDGERAIIITTEPVPAIAHIHNRMPLVLARQSEALWNDAARPFRDVAPLLATAADFRFEIAQSPRRGERDLFG